MQRQMQENSCCSHSWRERSKFPIFEHLGSARESGRSVNFSERLQRAAGETHGKRVYDEDFSCTRATATATPIDVFVRPCVWKEAEFQMGRRAPCRTVFAETILADWKLKFHVTPSRGSASHRRPRDVRNPFSLSAPRDKRKCFVIASQGSQHRFREPRAEIPSPR